MGQTEAGIEMVGVAAGMGWKRDFRFSDLALGGSWGRHRCLERP